MGYFTLKITPEGQALLHHQPDYVYRLPYGWEARETGLGYFAVWYPASRRRNPYAEYLFPDSEYPPALSGDITLVRRNFIADVFDELEWVGGWNRVSQLRAFNGQDDLDRLRERFLLPAGLTLADED